MRVLLITTFAGSDDAGLGLILEILAERGLVATTSGAVGAGAHLADGLTPDFEAAIAILPEGGAQSSGWSALMVEIGICLGARLPVLALVTPESKIPPALAPLQHVRADLADGDTLRLHLGMFIRGLAHRDRMLANQIRHQAWSHAATPAGPQDAEAAHPGESFEWRVADLLRGPTTLLASSSRAVHNIQPGVDLAFSIGGPANALVTVVEVKKLQADVQIESAVRQLAHYVGESGADLGLLVTELPSSNPMAKAEQGIVWLGIDQLNEIVRSGQLETVLRGARNRAVHGA